ncbi:MAG: hypothetical protein LBO07_02400 [Coriobacteriales bacterium]|jgi:hypothetical protein|nr:hypothetical protein [Coriobacteriales bacterium]
MTMRTGSKSRALFLELTLSFVLFTFCALVCLQIFAAARTSSDLSAAYSHLGREAQIIAEDFKAAEGTLSTLQTYLPDALRSSETLSLYFDRDLNALPATARTEAFYVLTCAVDASTPLRQATISASRIQSGAGAEELFSLTATRYVSPGTGSGPGDR